jgi:hypothetical protein
VGEQDQEAVAKGEDRKEGGERVKPLILSPVIGVLCHVVWCGVVWCGVGGWWLTWLLVVELLQPLLLCLALLCLFLFLFVFD